MEKRKLVTGESEIYAVAHCSEAIVGKSKLEGYQNRGRNIHRSLLIFFFSFSASQIFSLFRYRFTMGGSDIMNRTFGGLAVRDSELREFSLMLISQVRFEETESKFRITITKSSSSSLLSRRLRDRTFYGSGLSAEQDHAF
jgi:hypothetical protein